MSNSNLLGPRFVDVCQIGNKYLSSEMLIYFTGMTGTKGVWDNLAHRLIDPGSTLVPIEIKSGITISKDFFKGLNYWQNLTG